MELIGPYLIACSLLVAAGVGKAVRPGDTARALADTVPVGPTGMRVVVRVGAIVEAVLGTVALAAPRPASALAVAASYGTFAVVVVYLRSRGGALSSCGCFGTPDTPATMLHAVINVGLAVAALAVALSRPSGTIVSVLAGQPWHGLPLVGASALGAWLCYLAMAVLAELQAVRRPVGEAR